MARTFKSYVDNVNAYYGIRTSIDMLEVEFENWQYDYAAAGELES